MTRLTRSGLFDDFFKELTPGFYVRPLHGDALPNPSQIKIDVQETDEGYKVQAEIPGVAKEDIQVSIDGNVVSLRAEVSQVDEQKKDDKVLRAERYFGSIERSFQLPSEVDASKAKARYEQGVLTLSLPKKSGSAAQRLQIE
jgi:HSP20 family protein